MASQQVANYSNSTAALRSTITGQMQQIGDDREDDMKAFQAEILSQSSMFAKEKFIEKGPTALGGFKPVSRLIKRVTGKDTTPLRTAAEDAAAAVVKAKAGTDAEGVAAQIARTARGVQGNVVELKGVSDAAQTLKEQTQADLTEAQEDLAEKTSTLAEQQTQAAEAQTIFDQKDAAARGLQGRGTSQLDSIQSAVNDERDAASTALDSANERVSNASGDVDEATTKVQGLQQQFEEHSTAAATSAEKTAAATEADVASGVEDAAKAIRIEKTIKGLKDAEDAAAASEEGGDIFGALIAGGIALATYAIGSKVHVHNAVEPPAPIVRQLASYSATIGA